MDSMDLMDCMDLMDDAQRRPRQTHHALAFE